MSRTHDHRENAEHREHRVALAAEFHAQRAAVRGAGNGERMRVPLWEALVRSGATAYSAGDAYGVEGDVDRVPGWTFDRFGSTRTRLPDGRVICIAGEHEDHYDPDFFIYNDVVVIHPDGEIAIHGYSPHVFPPTDFHTATLVGDAIYVVGRLGYKRERGGSATPIYRLDVATHRIESFDVDPTSSPGWIYDHRSEACGNAICVAGGKRLVVDSSGTEQTLESERTHHLDLDRREWFTFEGDVPTVKQMPWTEGYRQLPLAREAHEISKAIARAVGPGHPLFATSDWWPVGEATEWPRRVVLRTTDGSGRLARSDSPDHTGRQSDDEMATMIYEGDDEWLTAAARESNATS